MLMLIDVGISNGIDYSNIPTIYRLEPPKAGYSLFSDGSAANQLWLSPPNINPNASQWRRVIYLRVEGLICYVVSDAHDVVLRFRHLGSVPTCEL